MAAIPSGVTIALPVSLNLPRAFLPETDPADSFRRHPQFAFLDGLGRDLPSLLHDGGFRERVRRLEIPLWPGDATAADDVPELRLCYVRLGFLASAYINQVGEAPVNVLPAGIAVPLCHVCRLLRRPPILSYDGYALYNWKRFDPCGPVALGNIDTIQNFVHLYDEHWFILVHVEIEEIAAELVRAMEQALAAQEGGDAAALNAALRSIQACVRRQTGVLKRIPEKMDPAIYFRTFRPYIRFFDNVIYEGVDQEPIDHRGETGAQSSIMPALEAFMKIPHRPSVLTEHLFDMRRYMPAEHRAVIETLEGMPDLRPHSDADAYNGVLDAIAAFREVHYGWAEEYINRRTSDPRGTGGTPYMQWLRQLILETRAHMV
jgi:indoleamine 2,3-dioxygenase